MLNSQRTFVSTLRKYCADRGIAFDVKSQGWLVVMRRGEQRHIAFGYDIGLNSAVAHRIANDKAATSEVLGLYDIPCIVHALFLSPKLARYVPAQGTWEAMLGLLGTHPDGIVVKPNEGTGGNDVFKVRTRSELELAVNTIFATENSLAIAPFRAIEEEVRVVLIDGNAAVVYSKQRFSIVGDGVRSLLQIALEAIPADRKAAVLPAMLEDLDPASLGTVPAEGEVRVLNWRHNLAAGAEPVLLEDGEVRDACVALATRAAAAIGIRFASVDVVRVNGAWYVLEVNSGVMMEALSKHHPELVEAAYTEALDCIFQA